MGENADYERKKRNVERQFKKMNYHYQFLKCCATCKHKYQTCLEAELECLLIEKGGWDMPGIEDLGVCDNYEPAKGGE